MNCVTCDLPFSLITGFSASNNEEDEENPIAESPSLQKFEIEFETRKVSYIFLNKEKLDVVPSQIVVAVDGNYVDRSDIEIGISTSETYNWDDYTIPSQNTVYSNGKVVIPIRDFDDFSFVPKEELNKVSSYVYFASKGRWENDAKITILDSSDEVVPKSQYRSNFRDGSIVFAYKTEDGDRFFIQIENQNQFVVGMKITSRDSDLPVEIKGIGFEILNRCISASSY